MLWDMLRMGVQSQELVYYTWIFDKKIQIPKLILRNKYKFFT